MAKLGKRFKSGSEKIERKRPGTIGVAQREHGL